MLFTTGTLTACDGGEHLTLPITINGVTRDLQFTREDVKDLSPATIDDARQAILSRLRSAVLEATNGNPTPLQVRNAVSGKTFEV